jgi:peptide/nickel transport system substrate-binding protein
MGGRRLRVLRTPAPLARLLLALSLTPLIGGCGLIGAPPAPDGRLVVASKNRIDTVDPAGAYTFGAMQLLSAIGDTLYSIEASGKIQPRLAMSLPVVTADGLRARVQLRRGVRFHDGTAFDAAAMVFTLRRFLAIGKLSYLLGDRVAAVRATGSHEIELTLRRPYSALAQMLSAVNLTPLSPTAYRQYARRLRNDRFVGTGPYRLSAFSDQKQRLDPFPGYWGPPPANRGLDLVALSNSTALFGALQSGEVDVLLSSSLDVDQQAALHHDARRGRLREGVGPALEIGYITLLTDQPPLNDPRLREAVAHSLDRGTISRRVSLGLRQPLRDLVPPSLPGALPRTWPDYSPARARQLYREAGFCRGKVLTLPLTFRSNIPSDRLFALTWQAQLRQDLGDCVRLEVNGMESTTAYRQLGDGAFPLILLDWMGDFPDADNYLVPLLGCEKEQGNRCLKGASAASGSFWAAPGLQQELHRSAALPGAARVALLQAIQRRTARANPYLPLWLVAPRAWARPRVSQPRYDGSGRVLLQQLRSGAHHRPAP